MNKVITIHLHGRAFQLEEPGYNKLRAYLDEAETKLAQDPDKTEIISDLEQSLGEKFGRFLNSGKTVVVEKEVEEVIKEMGPVQATTDEPAGSQNQEAPKTSSTVKKLYKIREGAMISGVCTGLAAYFNMDVTLVRLAFVLLVLITHGIGIVVYIIMAIVLPSAKNPAEFAAAFGQPFTAQDLVNRAKEEYARFSDKDERNKWRSEFRKWRKEARENRHQTRERMRQEKWAAKAQYYAENHHRFPTPFLGLLITILSIIWLFGLVSIIKHGMVFGLLLPASIPLWIAILAWFCILSFVLWPIKAARWHAYQEGQKPCCHHHGFFGSLTWLAFIAIAAWALWQYVPSSHPYFDHASLWWQHVWVRIKQR